MTAVTVVFDVMFMDLDGGPEKTIRVFATGEDMFDCFKIFRESISELESEKT